jgi:hypothetical protein
MRYSLDKPKRLGKFIESVRDNPIPETASKEWLKAIDLKKRQDTQFLEILELLNFVDQDMTPNHNWRDFQDKSKTSGVMSKSLRGAYSFMYQRYPNASNQSDSNLQQLFMERDLNKDQAARAVKTFKTLIRYAGWI